MRAGPNGYDEVPQFEVRKLMGRRFAIILAVMYVIEAALYGGGHCRATHAGGFAKQRFPSAGRF